MHRKATLFLVSFLFLGAAGCAVEAHPNSMMVESEFGTLTAATVPGTSQVLVIQEVWGVDEHMALPEGRRKSLEETMALRLTRDRPWDKYVATLRAAQAKLTTGPSQGRKVGAVGFCMGGSLALRLACVAPELGAAVVFYGGAPPHEQLAGIQCPVLGLYAEIEPNITGAVPALAEAMKQQGKRFEHSIYSGAPHAFFNDTRGNYRPTASRDAWARTLTFFTAHLG